MENYHAIFKNSIREVFIDYLASLKIPEIDYFAIGIQDTIHKKSASIMSQIEWQKTFKAFNFAPYDPVRNAAFKTKRTVIFFDEIDYLNSFGEEIMRQRKQHEIGKGMVIMDRQLTYNYMLTLATNYSKFDGHNYYLKYQENIMQLFKDLKLIIQPVAKQYALKNE